MIASVEGNREFPNEKGGVTPFYSGGEKVVRIKEVIPKEDYLVEVQFDNGSSIMLNMKSRLGTVRFSKLADMEFFKKVTTDGNQVLWGDEVEISISEAFQLAQK